MDGLKNRYLESGTFDSFIKDYALSRKKETEQLNAFLNSVELNTNYFRTGLKNNHKFKSNKDTDTYTIKCLNSNLNKISGLNKDNIINDILNECKNKKHLYPLFFDTILHKTITHSNYIECYALILKGLVDSETRDIFLKNIGDIKDEINVNHQIDNSSYENLCDINLYTDKIYGLNLLLVKLEKYGVLENYVQNNLAELFTIMEHTQDETIIYRVISCLFQMNEEINGLLTVPHRDKLISIKTNSKPKIKFKIADILDKYN
jgi:hypothetical protein|tara:strand:+ start:2780 stop:3565 length:786 start_codon:yes stop_codon:yes gene_type:complete